MACSINLYDDVIQGEDQEGLLTYLFYDSDQDGDADNGGSNIFLSQNGDVNFDGNIPGDYYFSHKTGEGDCEQELIFFVRVLDAANAGTGQSIDMCDNLSPVNIFSLINGNPDLTGTWSGNGVLNNGYDNNGTPNDPTDDTFNPSTSGVGVFNFIYTVNVIAPNGFQLSNCPNCLPQSTTVTINVIGCGEPPPPCNVGNSATVHVCSNAGCSFDLFDELGGNPIPGGEWEELPGAPATIIPVGSEGTVNFVGAPVGTYQFQYDITNLNPNCFNIAVVTVIVVAQPNAGNNFVHTFCDTGGAVNLFQYLGSQAQSGGVWSISPGLPIGTFSSNGTIDPAVGDAGTYTVTYTLTTPATNNPCGGSVCTDTATGTITILANCNAGADITTVVCKTASYTLNAITQLGASTNGGTYLVFGQSVNCNNVYTTSIFSVNGAPAEDHQGDFLNNGDILNNFASIGCIILVYNCNNGVCNDQSIHKLQIIDCAPSCAASVTISAVACALTGLITGTCPTPIYQWQVLSGGNFIPAPGVNNLINYTGLNGQTYRLQVTGCVNCGVLLSGQLTVSCPPAACNLSCSLIYNTTLQRLEATLTNSGTATPVQYLFNKANTNTPLCSNCNGWGLNQCTGNDADGSGFFTCSVPQTGLEQCWRFVAFPTNGSCSPTSCCVKIPAAAALCYELPALAPFTDIVQLTINAGSGNVNVMGASQFNATEYESTSPVGNMNGTVNVSLAQMVIDINQWLLANGHAGTAYIIQKSKSSSIRIQNTDIIFVSVTSIAAGVINFAASTCAGCDTTNWHFQGWDSINNFPALIGSGGKLNPSIAGTINLFTYIDLYFGGAPVDVPHTGTFTAALCGVSPGGCVDVNTSCWSDCSPPPPTPVTVVNHVGFADHGNLNWIVYTPTASFCQWQIRYSFTMPNGCTECILMVVWFDDSL